MSNFEIAREPLSPFRNFLNTDGLTNEQPSLTIGNYNPEFLNIAKGPVEPQQPVLRRSERIKKLIEKKRQEAMESKIQKAQEQPKVKRPKRRSIPTFRATYFECADINGKLYRLKDLPDPLFRRMQQYKCRSSVRSKPRNVVGNQVTCLSNKLKGNPTQCEDINTFPNLFNYLKLKRQQLKRGKSQKDLEMATGLEKRTNQHQNRLASLDFPKSVGKPHTAVRRSSRIAQAKLKKKVLETSLRRNQKNFLGWDKYFECADINGKLYKLCDVFEDLELGIALQKHQKKAKKQSSRRILGTAGGHRALKSKKDTSRKALPKTSRS